MLHVEVHILTKKMGVCLFVSYDFTPLLLDRPSRNFAHILLYMLILNECAMFGHSA